jgi:hypothetical protein
MYQSLDVPRLGQWVHLYKKDGSKKEVYVLGSNISWCIKSKHI